jgi:hypothetical protein
MKKSILLALVFGLLLSLPAFADEPGNQNVSSSDQGPLAQIVPADELVKTHLYPAWRSRFVSEARTWHLKGNLQLHKSAPADIDEPAAAELAEDKKKKSRPES